MTEDEVDDLITIVSRDPLAGDELAGAGGCRKIRIAGRGKGKSGGFRVVTFYSGTDMPVCLLSVFSKGEKANLTKAERNALADLTKQLVAMYRGRVIRVGERS